MMRQGKLLFTLYYIFINCLFAQSSRIIDLNNLANYANQPIPSYITKDNTPLDNPITDEGATLGRVLFYDKILSSNDSISCSSCHLQSFGFGDPKMASIGVNGNTSRHSMRLINTRFAEEINFFWDKRAATLEDQITMPIKNHIEMGFSGLNGDPSFDSLLRKIETQQYYKILFEFTFGDELVNEHRVQKSIAQFIRSIQSFDSKFDVGKSMGFGRNSFSNFTEEEKLGKELFETTPIFDENSDRIGGGIGCAQCHRGPEFDIDPESLSNSMIFSLGTINRSTGVLDILATKSPSLRGVFNPNGETGFLMHNSWADNFDAVLNVYSGVPDFVDKELSNLIDPRLKPNGLGQNLKFNIDEINQITSFVKTLTGTDVYTNPKWSNPFDSTGNIEVIPLFTSVSHEENLTGLNIFKLLQNYPNPFNPITKINYFIPKQSKVTLSVFNNLGRIVATLVNKDQPYGDYKIEFDGSLFPSGIYFYKLNAGEFTETKKMILLK